MDMPNTRPLPLKESYCTSNHGVTQEFTVSKVPMNGEEGDCDDLDDGSQDRCALPLKEFTSGIHMAWSLVVACIS